MLVEVLSATCLPAMGVSGHLQHTLGLITKSIERFLFLATKTMSMLKNALTKIKMVVALCIICIANIQNVKSKVDNIFGMLYIDSTNGEYEMADSKVCIQRKIRQLVYLLDYYGEKVSNSMDAEYKRIYSKYQSGAYTMDEIEEDINNYM